MRTNKKSKKPPVVIKPINKNQMHINVDGCIVKMNFPKKPESSVMGDIKCMMLGTASNMNS